MAIHRGLAMLLATVAVAFAACNISGSIDESVDTPDPIVDAAAIRGITVPTLGGTPGTTVSETAQYTGTVVWSPSDDIFAAKTAYTATITLRAKSGFSFKGVAANYFTVKGASSVSNPADSGVVTAIFPKTPISVDLPAISGVTAPVLGEIPVVRIAETAQYSGKVEWDGGWAWHSAFGGNKEYTATITLTAKRGYSFAGVEADFFTVAGASEASNPAGSGVITAIFPATASLSIGSAAGGGKVAYILQNGDTGFVAGEQRGLIVATNPDLTSGVNWTHADASEIAIPGGTRRTPGSGSSNTDSIIAQAQAYTADMTSYAAGLARNYGGGGFNDWFLPSSDELEMVSRNSPSLGFTITEGNYWTSTESDYNRAFYRKFGVSETYEGNTLKFYRNGIRILPVRYF